PDPSIPPTPALHRSTPETRPTFQCKLDSGSYATCTKPFTISPALGDGSHAFSVKQTDQAGNQSLTAATWTWTVDTTVPAVPSVTGHPSNPSTSSSASFTFTTDVGSTPLCSLDGGAFGACTSFTTMNYTGLAVGSHTFQVEARDTAGNTGPAASFAWSISGTAPSLLASAVGSSGTAITLAYDTTL